MKIVELKFAASYDIIYRGQVFHFEKGKPRQVPEGLADKVLSTGDFMDVIINDPDFQIAVNEPPVQEEKVEEKVEETVDHKMEVPTDLKKKKKKRERKEKETDTLE